MASSQIATTPFGCVLSLRNRWNRETNARTAFQQNLQDLVSCISSSAPVETSCNADVWVREEQSKPNSQVRDRWARARQMVTTIERQSREQRENSPTQSDSSVETSNLGGVSSLVQRWRDISEARTNQSAPINIPNVVSSPVELPPLSRSETCESVDEKFGTPTQSVMTEEDSFLDFETEATPSFPQSARARDSVESERLRVADVIKKLTSENRMQGSLMSWKNDNDNESLSRLNSGSDDHQQQEQKCFSNLKSLPLIRGRQAFTELLLKRERDRMRELDGLVARRAVSTFSHRGRIQAMLRLRFLRREAAVGYQQHSHLPPVRAQRHWRREAAAVVGAQQHWYREAVNGHQQNLRHEAEVKVFGAQQHSCGEAVNGDQQNLRHEAEVKGLVAQQHSCHEAVNGDQQNLRHEAEVRGFGAQQHSGGEATVVHQQHSHSTTTGVQQHSTHSTTTGIQQHSCCEAVGGKQMHLNSTEVGTPQHLHPEAEHGAQQHLCIRDQQHSHSTANESNRPTQGSVVVLLREKFDVRVESDAAHLKPLRGVVENNVESFTSNQLGRVPCHQEVNNTEQQSSFSAQNSISYTREDVHEEANRSSHNIWQRTSYEICNLDSQESADRLTSSSGWKEDVNAEEHEANNQELIETNQDSINDVSHPRDDWEEQETNNQQQMETDQIQDWISVISHPWTEWDEQEIDNQQIVGMSHDWIREVSRPRSDWEGLRQARYQEMLDPYMENEDVRQLLERRRVSTFLSSNLREKMDQLMISRVQRLPHSLGNQQEEEDEDGQRIHNRLEKLMMSHLQRQKHLMSSLQEEEEQEDEEEEQEGNDGGEEEEEDEEEFEEEEEEDEEEFEEEEEAPESSIEHQYNEVSDYVDQVAAVRSWSRDGDHEVGYDSDQVASPSRKRTRSSQSSYSSAQPRSSFTNRSSIEMELIYDLRGHMEQLHHEISELRRSIKSCTNMQVKLQRSMKQEVAAAVSRSVPRAGRESLSGAPRKGSCSVCYEMKIDSLLYRCGHMCTCFKCAHELLWSSGKCPICRAPIEDVVRAYVNDS